MNHPLNCLTVYLSAVSFVGRRRGARSTDETLSGSSVGAKKSLVRRDSLAQVSSSGKLR